MHLNEIKIGSVLCDMHYGLNLQIFEEHLVAAHDRMRSEGGSRFIDAELMQRLGRPYLYLNKMLVVTDVLPAGPGGVVRVRAMYSYDDCTVGWVDIDVWPPAALQGRPNKSQPAVVAAV